MSEEIQTLPNPLSFTRKLLYWLPPFLWMAMIFLFSTDAFSAGNTGGLVMKIAYWLWPNLTAEEYQIIHFSVRKAGHFTVYAVLAFLLFRAFRFGSLVRWRRPWGLYSLFVVGIYALLDEYHQTFTQQRTGSVYDSLIDFSGGACMLLIIWLFSLRKTTK